MTNKPVKTAGNPPKNSWHTKRHIPSTFTQNTLQIKQEHAQHCVVTGMHNNITNETRHLVGRNVSSSSPPEFASFESFPLAHCPVEEHCTATPRGRSRVPKATVLDAPLLSFPLGHIACLVLQSWWAAVFFPRQYTHCCDSKLPDLHEPPTQAKVPTSSGTKYQPTIHAQLTRPSIDAKTSLNYRGNLYIIASPSAPPCATMFDTFFAFFLGWARLAA